MDSLLNRYRNITVLLLVIFAQLVLLAYQVKGNQDVRLIRVWAVTAVTPVARAVEGVRSGTMRILRNYVLLHNLEAENRQLKTELGKLKLANIDLKNELETADRLKALANFQEHTPSKTLPARVIGTGTGGNARVIFVDQGSSAGVMRGMAVITPDGIVGKVTAAYPTASQVLLITDPGFAAGVISQKHRVHGTVRGLPQGGACEVDYVQNEEKVETGEMFFTSGDDRIFPKGFPVGVVTAVRPGQYTKQIFLRPAGVTGGLEEVLVVVEGVHQAIPEYQAASPELHLTPAPPPDPNGAPDEKPSDQSAATEADRLREQYKKLGEAQNHVFGVGLPGSKPPDFNMKLPPAGTPPQTGAAGQPKPGGIAGQAATGGTPQTGAAGQTPGAAPARAQAPGPKTNAGQAGRPTAQAPTAVKPPAEASPGNLPARVPAGSGGAAGAARPAPKTATGAQVPGGLKPPLPNTQNTPAARKPASLSGTRGEQGARPSATPPPPSPGRTERNPNP